MSASMPEGEEQAPRGTTTMAMVRWIFVVLMATVAAASIVYVVKPDLFYEHKTSTSVLYICPMHPEIVRDRPSICPICGMDLVVKEPDNKSPSELSGLSIVSLTPERVQLLGMVTTPAKRQSLPQTLRSLGFATPNENLRILVQTKVSGWIGSVFTTQAALVRKGEVLATVYNPEIVSAQHEFLKAKRKLNARKKLAALGFAEQDLNEFEKNKKVLHAMHIRSPNDGYIQQKNIFLGTYVQPDTVLFEIIDWSKIWVHAEVYEQDVGTLQTGQKARLKFLAYPEFEFTGSVLLTAPELNEDARTLRVRIEVDNPDLKIRPGMYSDVTFETRLVEAVFAPRQAIIDNGSMQYVFVVQNQTTFVPKKVVLGIRSGDLVEIQSGVEEGDEVLTTGNFLIDSESRMNSAFEEFKPPHAH
jgi:membrane fusion protein, copper/silver efflux system